jgi:hypothetical protein
MIKIAGKKSHDRDAKKLIFAEKLPAFCLHVGFPPEVPANCMQTARYLEEQQRACSKSRFEL